MFFQKKCEYDSNNLIRRLKNVFAQVRLYVLACVYVYMRTRAYACACEYAYMCVQAIFSTPHHARVVNFNRLRHSPRTKITLSPPLNPPIHTIPEN